MGKILLKLFWLVFEMSFDKENKNLNSNVNYYFDLDNIVVIYYFVFGNFEVKFQKVKFCGLWFDGGFGWGGGYSGGGGDGEGGD